MKIDGVIYDIDWSDFPKGQSVFIPCLDQHAAKKYVYEEAQRLEVAVFVRGEPYNGIKGVRVWRL